MAEHPAVNRRVVSSNLTCGARFVRKVKERATRESGLLLFVPLFVPNGFRLAHFLVYTTGIAHPNCP
jgi:hypothetical protein